MIEILSYQSVNGVPFGSPEKAIVEVLGEPALRHVNNEGAHELHYPHYIARLDADTRTFREFTLLRGCVASINGLTVEWQPAFLSAIQDWDSSLMEVSGFIVSLKMGLSLTGFHDDDPAQMAIHAFRQSVWDNLLGEMNPFRWNH